MDTDIISEKEVAVADVVCYSCANCGVAAVDEIKLKPCPHCDLVHYCSDECRQDHRELHEERCFEREAEIHDEILFKQPESSHLGDCQICCLPMPLDINARSFRSCCGQRTCNGCFLVNAMYEVQRGEAEKCPFCRTISPTSDEENAKRMWRRSEANDPIALGCIGWKHYEDEDFENAFRCWTRAAEEGNEDARFRLGGMYLQGRFVEKNVDECISHLEQAAIRGHVEARFNLGYLDWKKGKFDRAVKHWIISASLGDNISVQELKKSYKLGHASKDDFARALRAHQAAVDAMKSTDREFAEIYYQARKRM